MEIVANNFASIPADTFVGIYDFAYAPYALGDCLTWQENVLVHAIESNYKNVRLCLVTDPRCPSGRLQPHINSANFGEFIRGLYPAFFCNPLASTVHVFRNRDAFDAVLLDARKKGVKSWPSFRDHYRQRLDFISHTSINRFYRRNGYLPRLVAPRGYVGAVDSVIGGQGERGYTVIVNIRQSGKTETPNNLHRDSPANEWHRFFRNIGTRFPDVRFYHVGNYDEWSVELMKMKHSNVTIMRQNGYTLGHELALLHACDLFMGTSSGFAAAATFSETPYIITNMEPRFSGFSGVPVGVDRYPFGDEHQTIHWEKETAEFLTDRFAHVYAATRNRHRSIDRVRTNVQ